MGDISCFSNNVTSQFGEDGIVDEIFKRIGVEHSCCVEFGAWDGKYLSNTWNLWHSKGWASILIEGDKEKYLLLEKEVASFEKVKAVNAFVSTAGKDSLDTILTGYGVPTNFDLLSIDIDGDEYYIFQGLKKYVPRVVIIEYNPTIPPEFDIVQSPGEYFGASVLALTNLAKTKGYSLVCCTETNCFFIRDSEFHKLGIQKPSLMDIFPRNNLAYVISAYNGLMFLSRTPTYSRSLRKLSLTSVGLEMIKVLSNMRGKASPGTGSALPFYPVAIFNRAPVPGDVVAIRRVARRGKQILKTVLAWLAAYDLVQNARKRSHNRKLLREWEEQGKPDPPPHLIKQRTIKSYAHEFHLVTLVETGTYLGEMVEATSRLFQRIFSIELDPTLYAQAKQKFSKLKHVTILQGDSGEVLPGILADIHQPCLFWLDGHYSGGNTAKGEKETPILSEIDIICRHRINRHVILVDDARCFDGSGDYPTLADLEQFVRERRPDAVFEVKDDIIRIL